MPKVPVRYIPKRLTRRDKKQQRKELRKSRAAYKKGKYHTRKKVSSFKSKVSPHVLKAQKIYGVDKISASSKLATKTGCSRSALQKIVKKGQGAYFSSGSRPNQTGHSWGRARLASSITGGRQPQLITIYLKKVVNLAVVRLEWPTHQEKNMVMVQRK